jgi:hypothetical protein
VKHIFLSYSRADAEIMRRVRDTLTGEGLAVWTDESLTPGTPSWQSALENALDGAGCVVVLLSPDARKSQWVANELSYASAHGVVIFPTLVRGEEKDSVPLQLINAQRVDLRARFLAGMQTLVDALRDYLSRLEDEDESGDSEEDKAAWMGRSRLYPPFWKILQTRSTGRTALFTNLTALDNYFLGTSAGRKGVKFGYLISPRWGMVKLYIDLGDKTHNKAFYDALYAQRDSIESEFGAALDWQRLDNKRSSQVVLKFDDGGLDDRDSWPTLMDKMIDAMIRLDTVMRPRVAAIEI